MQMKEIVPGVEYAYKPHKHSGAKRVKVLRTGVPMKTGRYSSSTTQNIGVEVEVVDGPQVGLKMTVRSREIEVDWQTFAEREALAKADRLARDRQNKATAIATAERMFLVHTALVRLGEPYQVQTIPITWGSNKPTAEMLATAGFVLTESAMGSQTASPLDLGETLRTGRVSLRSAEALANAVLNS
jgi:hypothetical protein